MVKEFKLVKNTDGNWFLVKVETLQDFKIFCETRYYKDEDISFFWKMFERNELLEFCLSEAEFKKYYLKGEENE